MNDKDIEAAKRAMDSFKRSGIDKTMKEIQDITKPIQPVLEEARKNNLYTDAYLSSGNPELEQLRKQIIQIQNSGNPFSKKKLDKMIDEFGLPGSPTINLLNKLNSLQEQPNKNSEASNDDALNNKYHNEYKNSTYETSAKNDRNDYGNNSDNASSLAKNKSFRYVKSNHYKCSDWIISKNTFDHFNLVPIPFSTFNTSFDFFSKKFNSNSSPENQANFPEDQANFWKSNLNKVKRQSDNLDIINKSFELAKNIAWVIAVGYYLFSHIF